MNLKISGQRGRQYFVSAKSETEAKEKLKNVCPVSKRLCSRDCITLPYIKNMRKRNSIGFKFRFFYLVSDFFQYIVDVEYRKVQPLHISDI